MSVSKCGFAVGAALLLALVGGRDAAAQPPPWVQEMIAAGQAGGKPPFFVRLFSSRKTNRANEEVGRLYFIPRFGAMAFRSQPPPGRVQPPEASADITGEWGAAVSGAIGTGLGYHLRSEVEVGFMAYSGRVCAQKDTRRGCTRADDAIINLMLHLVYDFDMAALAGRSLGWWDNLLFYFGGGAGYSFSTNPTTVTLPPPAGSTQSEPVRLNVTEEKFLGAANAGMLYQRLEFGYRYLVGPANVGGHHIFVGFRF